jgi:hypothetical protein
MNEPDMTYNDLKPQIEASLAKAVKDEGSLKGMDVPILVQLSDGEVFHIREVKYYSINKAIIIHVDE